MGRTRSREEETGCPGDTKQEEWGEGKEGKSDSQTTFGGEGLIERKSMKRRERDEREGAIDRERERKREREREKREKRERRRRGRARPRPRWLPGRHDQAAKPWEQDKTRLAVLQGSRPWIALPWKSDLSYFFVLYMISLSLSLSLFFESLRLLNGPKGW